MFNPGKFNGGAPQPQPHFRVAHGMCSTLSDAIIWTTVQFDICELCEKAVNLDQRIRENKIALSTKLPSMSMTFAANREILRA